MESYPEGHGTYPRWERWSSAGCQELGILFICLLGCCLVAMHVQLLAVPWTVACQASLSPTISQRVLRFVPIESGCSGS